MMKLLVLLIVVLGAVWLWQRGRRAAGPSAADRAARKVLPMVRCHHCGVHVPGGDAIAGRQGAYCSADHRRASEGS
jgi:uncharacterized protein